MCARLSYLSYPGQGYVTWRRVSSLQVDDQLVLPDAQPSHLRVYTVKHIKTLLYVYFTLENVIARGSVRDWGGVLIVKTNYEVLEML